MFDTVVQGRQHLAPEKYFFNVREPNIFKIFFQLKFHVINQFYEYSNLY